MKEIEGVTEKLKADSPMEWVCRMQNIEARAREVINRELIDNMNGGRISVTIFRILTAVY